MQTFCLGRVIELLLRKSSSSIPRRDASGAAIGFDQQERRGMLPSPAPSRCGLWPPLVPFTMITARSGWHCVRIMILSMPGRDVFPPDKRRSRRAPPFQMTERDIAIVEAVYRYRMLERRQIENLFFLSATGQRTNTSYARKRLRRLYLHGYLERILRPIDPSEGSRGPVYRLGPTGARLLAQQAGVPVGQFHYWGRGDDQDSRRTQVQPLFLEHGLALADVRIAIEQAAKMNDVCIEAWRDDVEIRHARDWDSVIVATEDGQQKRIPINPDGYFILSAAHGRGHFFLENGSLN